ncbi:aromatic amino acid lyase [Leucobacter sp. CSA2]|uniref:Aromatic amino acid lyase n=1 Tax=Leucobacter edaphi TaxID=2796472 RepID=A0A934QCB8_9MICO|nr:aromatic amino acid ammonia-lyase [Leucobacter edaphi]MBK0421573.1 aromatic amino acid lyase [Leucobacter edaphi]
MLTQEYTLHLGATRVTPDEVARVSRGEAPVRLDETAHRRIDAARAVVAGLIARGTPAYGVTRGLGPLQDQPIPPELQRDFQTFVFASHHAGCGENLSRAEARSVMIARLAVMAQGNSGGSRELITGLAELVSRGVTPAIPVAGSVGSADLAPLAAVGTVLVGRGRALGRDGTPIPGDEALRAAGIEPVSLQAKDGHALVVANAGAVGIGCLALVDLERLARIADLAAVHSVEALSCNTDVFDDAALSARPHPGQVRSGARLRRLLAGGALSSGEVRPARLQDPLSFRTIPQVHGVILEQAAHLREVLDIELNSMPENPFIDESSGTLIANGNFSALRLALSLDQCRIALAHLGLLAERRIAVLIGRLRADRPLSEQLVAFASGSAPVVPPILANVAASISARLQHLAAPFSILPSIVGDGIEDHNSQAYSAALALRDAIELAEQLFTIEALAASGVSASEPETHARRRGPGLAPFAALASRILESYEPTGGTQAQLTAMRCALHKNSRCKAKSAGPVGLGADTVSPPAHTDPERVLT